VGWSSKSGQVDAYDFKSFLCTSDRDEVENLSLYYPERWNIESFFRHYQALGWNRTGTLSLNIQYARMTMALFDFGAARDSEPIVNDFVRGLEGDIRVKNDTIIITYYNAQNLEKTKMHYENLPKKLISEGINPKIPWLYYFKIDFRFK